MKTIENQFYMAELERDTPGTEDKTRFYSVEVKVWQISFWDGPQFDVANKGELFVEGFIKWDGCSNWTFHTERCMHHHCDREGLEAIGDILAKCWEACAEIIPETWSP